MSAKKILVVDFDAESIDFLSDYLQNEGYSILTATDGISGLEKYESSQPDLVIMEAMLPRLHGFELCAKIAKEGRKTPVIILTGIYKDAVYKTEALRTFGASAYFEKPCAIGSFRTAIHRILGKPESSPKKDEGREAPIPAGKISASLPAPKTPAAPAKEPNSVNDEVEMMLKKALADVGWKPAKKAAATSPTIPLPAKPATTAAPIAATVPGPDKEPKTEAKIHFPKPLVLKDEQDIPEPPKVILPPVLSVAPPDEDDLPRVDFVTEKKKGFPSKIIAMGFVLLVVGSVGFLLLRPHQRTSPQDDMAPQTASWSPPEENIQTEPAADIRRTVVPDQAAATRTASKETPPVKTGANAKNATAEDNADVTEVKPLLPQAPVLKPQIQTPDVLPTDAAKSAPPGQAQAEERAAPRPPARTNAGDLVPLEKADAYPRVLSSVEPAYPTAARQLKMEGVVLVNALINENGDVLQVNAVPGNNMAVFEKSAENAVMKWKFYPAQKDGVNVKVWKLISITFKLK
jgi:TonB family protein